MMILDPRTGQTVTIDPRTGRPASTTSTNRA